MKLVEAKNLGYSKTGSAGVQEPCNLPEMDKSFHTLFDTCPKYYTSLYERVVDIPLLKPLVFVPGIEKAIARLMYTYFNKNAKGYGGCGFDTEGNFYADYYGGSVKEYNRQKQSDDFSKSRRQIFKIDTDENISAVCIDENGNRTQLFLNTALNRAGTHTSSGVIYALVAFVIYSNITGRKTDGVSEVLKLHFDSFKKAIEDDNDLEKARQDRLLGADIYTIFAKDKEIKAKYGLNTLNLTKYDRDEFPILTQTEFNLVEMFGDSDVLTNKAVVSGSKVDTSNIKLVKDLLGKFKLSERTLSEKEQALVPDDNLVKGDYIVRQEVLDALKVVCESSSSPNPVRNILWTGGAGTGKTTSCQMFAQILGLPYVFYTFHPSTEINDLYMNIMPRTSGMPESSDSVESLMEKLDFTSIAFDPVGSYESLTGEVKPDATEEDCKRVIAKSLLNSANNDSQFISVESPLVQAFRYGYVCELQEANVARKPGVLAGINAALDNLATIQLPSGEVIKRHKDTIIILTANIGYASRTAFDQAVVSRCQLYDEFEAPSDAELKSLIQTGSGFKDSKTIDKMIKVYHGINAKLEETGATDGICGVRELIQWAIMSNTFSPYKACIKAMINKATFDKEVRHELIICLETQFKDDEEFNF